MRFEDVSNATDESGRAGFAWNEFQYISIELSIDTLDVEAIDTCAKILGAIIEYLMESIVLDFGVKLNFTKPQVLWRVSIYTVKGRYHSCKYQHLLLV